MPVLTLSDSEQEDGFCDRSELKLGMKWAAELERFYVSGYPALRPQQ